MHTNKQEWFHPRWPSYRNNVTNAGICWQLGVSRLRAIRQAFILQIHTKHVSITASEQRQKKELALSSSYLGKRKSGSLACFHLYNINLRGDLEVKRSQIRLLAYLVPGGYNCRVQVYRKWFCKLVGWKAAFVFKQDSWRPSKFSLHDYVLYRRIRFILW